MKPDVDYREDSVSSLLSVISALSAPLPGSYIGSYEGRKEPPQTEASKQQHLDAAEAKRARKAAKRAKHLVCYRCKSRNITAKDDNEHVFCRDCKYTDHPDFR